jgi:hypothetical protein
MGLSIIFGLLIVLALHRSNLGFGRSIKGAIEMAAGALLMVIAVAEGSGRKVQWRLNESGESNLR